MLASSVRRYGSRVKPRPLTKILSPYRDPELQNRNVQDGGPLLFQEDIPFYRLIWP